MLKVLNGEVRAFVRSEKDLHETWKVRHNEAMAVYEIEDGIRLALHAVEGVFRWDENVSRQALDRHIGEGEYAAFGVAAAKILRIWLEAAGRLNRFATRLEGHHYKVDGREKLDEAIVEVRGVLTPSKEFFKKHPGLHELETAARTSRGRGETELLTAGLR